MSGHRRGHWAGVGPAALGSIVARTTIASSRRVHETLHLMDTGRSGRHLELGRRGEQFAAEWLLAQGWTIVLRNHREGHRELDLVVTRGAVLAFVEVKSRRGTAFGHPFEAITRKKQAEVRRAARAWLTSESGRSWVAQRRRRVGGQIEFRFDAVAVRFGPRGQVDLEYLPDAWR